jgi:lysophospholipase
MTEPGNLPESSAPESGVHYKRGRMTTADQLDLVWQAWIPPQPHGVILIVHGLAEHSGRYQETAEYFSASGWAVYACDLRGHGLSPDSPKSGRVHVNRFSDYFNDVDALLGLAKNNHDDLPLFILGHSMGGLISIAYALSHPGRLDGAIISSPALGTHPEFKPPLLLKLLVSILSRLAPRLLVDSALDVSAISRDPNVVQDYIDDPLVSRKVSARWYSEIMKAMKRVHDQAASLQVPMLLMQSGADRLVDPGAPRQWADAAPDSLVELVTWEGLYHEMLNEPEKDRVRTRILDWLRHTTRS